MTAMILVSIRQQRLQLREGETVLMDMPVATASNGAGERFGSECTPRGWHRVRAKIGHGLAPDSVLVGRRPTGEIFTPSLREQHPGRDWILTRILWLSGLEPGKNRLGQCDTMRRYIYIHGCPDDEPMGEPGSHGCIRMRNSDVIQLFDGVEAGTRVFITEGELAQPTNEMGSL